MAESTRPRMFVALVHFPVYNKTKEIVTSSVTTLDVHDISRICCTYGVEGFYVVTPLETQQALVQRIIDHWKTGYGAEYNPSRKQALEITSVKNVLKEVVEEIEATCGQPPLTLIPDAKSFPMSVSYETARQEFVDGQPYLLVLGTGWGLEKGIVERADRILAPIEGTNGYNHLPVRAALAIILDRLLSPDLAK